MDRPLTHLPRTQITQALAAAREFLRRFDDGFTRSNREELSQDSVVLGLSRFTELRDKGRFESYVRTIARRQRAQAIDERVRLPTLSLDVESRLRELPAQDQEDRYRIADELVPREQLFGALPCALARLDRINARLLMEYYGGATFAELAARHDMPPNNIKVRVHRARRRVKQLLMRTLGTLEGGESVSPSAKKRKGRRS